MRTRDHSQAKFADELTSSLEHPFTLRASEATKKFWSLNRNMGFVNPPF
jgi:hypothetical protein